MILIDSTHNIKKINRVKASDAVFSQMRNNIVLNIWENGLKLPSEQSLTKLFGVSKTTIRSAINRLNAVGLAKTRNGEGTFVIQKKFDNVMNVLLQELALTTVDILELLEFRKGIERLSCSLAAQRVTGEGLEHLSEILYNMTKSREQGDYAAYSVFDIAFHKQLAKMSTNSVIQSVFDVFENLMFSKIKEMNNKIGTDLGYDYHVRIFEAVKAKDSALAEQLISENLDKSIEHVKKMA